MSISIDKGPQVEQRLALHRDELVEGLQDALQATLFSHRPGMRPFLGQIAAEEAEAFLAFLKREDISAARAQGSRQAREGLGTNGLLHMRTTLRRFCHTHLEDNVLDAALSATEAYTGAFLEGFLEVQESIVLEEQERIRAAMQRTLTRFTLQLQTVAEIARAASSILDLDELLNTAVDLIRNRFDLYYAGVFLVDEARKWAVLRAGTGEPGREMLRQGHRLKVGGQSMIGWCVDHREARIAFDVGKEAVHFDNPLLPKTHSELALPLIARGQAIGAMTIQSSRIAAFSDEDITTFQILADQLAAAIENARLFQQTQDSLKEISRLHQRYLRQEWQAYVADEEARARTGYLYEQGAVKPAENLWMPEISQAAWRRETVVRPDMAAIRQDSAHSGDVANETASAEAGEALQHRGKADRADRRQSGAVGSGAFESSPAQAALAVPLTLRGQVIGALDFYETEQQRQWSRDDIALVESVADQVALALENARAYAELQRTAEQLKEVDRLKSQFLANMSHELRTPLNSIIGFSRVILKGIDGPLTDMQRTDLQAVYDGGQHLLGLINDILDISKIEAGKMELTIEDVNLGDTIKGVMSTAIALVKDKPVELQQSVPSDLPTIRGDARRIRQVLLNLVSNAAKFTEQGFIRVEAEAHPTEVLISVADSGIGIPPDKMALIFEPFTQADASTTRQAGGTGLGLSISKRFTEIHGGRIWVESEVGVGSTFYVAFPLKSPTELFEEIKPEELEAEQEGDKKVVLCVDDDDGVIVLFRRYLSKRGYQIVGLTDSTSVVERARQLNPFAITLDVMMPGKDGWQVIQELRADSNTSNIPVIMCTIVCEEEYGLSLGASDYLIKPVLEEELVAALERLDQKEGRHLVLVVDDQEENRSLLRRMIEGKDGYEVVEASGGQEAISLVQEIHPHVIVLDLMMPEVDGFAVLEALKSNKATRSIPIIVVTAKDLTPEERDILNKGVEALLQKGLFEQQELLADVAAALDRL